MDRLPSGERHVQHDVGVEWFGSFTTGNEVRPEDGLAANKNTAILARREELSAECFLPESEHALLFGKVIGDRELCLLDALLRFFEEG